MSRIIRSLLIMCLCLIAHVANAQSTAIGKIIYAPDLWWKSAQEHNWQLKTWDNTENKSATCTGVIVYVGGSGLAAITSMSSHRGRQVIAGVYVIRAVYGLTFGETDRYQAHLKHVAAAMIASSIQFNWKF